MEILALSSLLAGTPCCQLRPLRACSDSGNTCLGKARALISTTDLFGGMKFNFSHLVSFGPLEKEKEAIFGEPVLQIRREMNV